MVGGITLVLALALVGLFYLHAIVGRPSSVTTPLALGVIAVLLGLLMWCGVATNVFYRVGTPLRWVSALSMYVALFLGGCSTLRASIEKPFSVQDWGVAFVQLGIPILITFAPSRVSLLKVIPTLAAAFALADLAANASTAFGFGDFANQIGTGTSYGTHWLGIPDNSFAEGYTAFIALAGLSWEIGRRPRLAVILRLPILAALVFSLWMIRARTDFAVSLLTILVLIFRRFFRVPAALLAVVIGAGLLSAVFYGNPYGTNETLRSMLITNGFYRALQYPFLGAGPHYLNSTELATASFIRLSRAGVTESGALDWAVGYGIPSTFCLFASAFCALLASRSRVTLPAVLLAASIGSLAIAGGLLAPVMTVVFFSSLIVCQREEVFILAARSDVI